MNIGSLLHQTDEMKRILIDEASHKLSDRKQEFFGTPPTFNKISNTYESGKKPDIEKIKSVLKDYLIY